MTEAEKEFEKADIANAKKRAEELSEWAEDYKSALRELQLAKVNLKRVIDSAKEDGFGKAILDAVIAGQFVQGVEKIAFLKVINPETPEKTDDSEKPNCDEEPTTDSENELVNDEDNAEENESNV